MSMDIIANQTKSCFSWSFIFLFSINKQLKLIQKMKSLTIPGLQKTRGKNFEVKSKSVNQNKTYLFVSY